MQSDLRRERARGAARRSKEASTQSAIRAVRRDATQLHLEEALARVDNAGVYRDLSQAQKEIARKRESHSCLQSVETVVQRTSTRLHTSYAHVHRDISVVHRQRPAQRPDLAQKFHPQCRTAQRHVTRAQGLSRTAQRHAHAAKPHACNASRPIWGLSGISCVSRLMNSLAHESFSELDGQLRPGSMP